MKTISFLLIAFVLCSFRGNTVDNSLYDKKLKGKVRSVTEYEFFKNKSGNEKLFRKTIYVYDERGNVTTRSSYKDDKLDLNITWEYKYDENGNKIEEDIYNPDKSLSVKTIYKYDLKGTMTEIEKSTKTETHIIERYTYEYDDKGNKTEEVGYKENGEIDYKSTFKYNGQGNLLETTEEDKDKAKVWVKYNYKGNEVEFSVNSPMSNLDYKYYYDDDFDEMGNWLKRMEVSELAGHKDTMICKQEINYY